MIDWVKIVFEIKIDLLFIKDFKSVKNILKDLQLLIMVCYE